MTRPARHAGAALRSGGLGFSLTSDGAVDLHGLGDADGREHHPDIVSADAKQAARALAEQNDPANLKRETIVVWDRDADGIERPVARIPNPRRLR